MKRLVFIVFIFSGCFLLSRAQKSKVIAALQLIETGRYKDAKKAIEEALDSEKTRKWPRTWYAKGLLCQTACREGMEENDKTKYELYPDQLHTAVDSYEKARSLDKRGRLDDQMAPRYVLLANEFQRLGKKHYNNQKYEEALKKFEQALQINQSPILTVRIDTNLIYNTALAAYEAEKWEKAIEYLEKLNKGKYSSNVPHLLCSVYLGKADTISAKRVLIEGIDRYKDHEDLVLLLADLFLQTDAEEKAITVLDTASLQNPSEYIYPYTKGLVYQKTDQYKKAIDAYKKAIALAPGEAKIYANTGTCYYNLGVEIEKNARTITNNRAFRQENERSEEAFETAVSWFEEAYERDPDNQYVIEKLSQLYKVLGFNEKMKTLEGKPD